jgi:uncharacterized protein YbaA (DUF1428 family)
VVFKEFGALKVVECWGDDVPDGKVTSFPMAMQKKDEETVVFSWIVWPSRETRDAGMKKMMEDPRMQPDTTRCRSTANASSMAASTYSWTCKSAIPIWVAPQRKARRYGLGRSQARHRREFFFDEEMKKPGWVFPRSSMKRPRSPQSWRCAPRRCSASRWARFSRCRPLRRLAAVPARARDQTQTI